MGEPNDKASATIYSYRLIKKTAYHPFLLSGYVLLLVFFCIYEFFTDAPYLALVPISYIVVQGLHAAIVSAYLRMTDERLYGTWGMVLYFPWIGLLPKGYLSLFLMKRVHIQLLWVGLTWIGCAYLWIPAPLFLQLVFLHLWTLLPRFVIFGLLPKPSPGGMLKISRKDAAYYMQ